MQTSDDALVFLPGQGFGVMQFRKCSCFGSIGQAARAPKEIESVPWRYLWPSYKPADRGEYAPASRTKTVRYVLQSVLR